MKYVLIVPDGAADLLRNNGASPLELARTEALDFLARAGTCGRMRTLYEDLSKGSLVALLGMLGWSPHLHYPGGRASFELLGLGEDYSLADGDLAFRANFVHLDNGTLASYNAGFITNRSAAPLTNLLNGTLHPQFPDFQLIHNSDFRNTLVIRGAGVDPADLLCVEPHESEGVYLDLARLVIGRNLRARALAERLNRYLVSAMELLHGTAADGLLPWSPSCCPSLPSFRASTGFSGRTAIVGFMDFLAGLARIGGMDFIKVGNGRVDTDYKGKGVRLVEALASGYEFVVCHINAPDEASHMGDLQQKIRSLEEIDLHIVRAVVEYFKATPHELGGVLIVPDHFTNVDAGGRTEVRSAAHASNPVPFALWNGRERDGVVSYSEEQARHGRYGVRPVSHLDLLTLLGVRRWVRKRSRIRMP